jgi:hypothetical protein
VVSESWPPPSQPASRTGDAGVRYVTNTIAVVALAFGLLSVPSSINPFAGVLLGVIAIILGAIGLSRSGQMGGVGRGAAVTGIVSALLGLLLSGLFFAGYAALDDALNSVEGQRFRERASEFFTEFQTETEAS